MLASMCVHAKSLQSCSTLCCPIDCNLPGSSLHGIHQARILEWVAMPSSRGSSWTRDRTHVSHLLHWQMGGGLVPKSCPTLGTPWTVARQVLPSMGFSRQENWSGLPFPSPGDLPDPGIEPESPAWQAYSLLLRHLGSRRIYIPNSIF